MVNFLGLVLAIVVFALGCLYYVLNARQLSEMFVQSALKMPRFLRFLFPIRWYQSEATMMSSSATSVWANCSTEPSKASIRQMTRSSEIPVLYARDSIDGPVLYLKTVIDSLGHGCPPQ